MENQNLNLAACNQAAHQKVVIFGTRDLAQLAYYYLGKDSPFEVVAFTVESEFIDADVVSMPDGMEFSVVAFETLYSTFPPSEFSLFIPVTGRRMNRLRKELFEKGQAMGYSFISYISSAATVFENVIGANCFILENNTIQPYASIGDNVVLWSGNHIGHHSMIGSHTFLTSHIVVSGNCVLGERCWVGVNASIRDGVTIEQGTLIGMGSLVTSNTDENGFYLGIPARKQTRSADEVI